MFSRTRNPFLILLLSYHVSVTSEIQVNFRFRRYLKILLIVSYKFLKFSHHLCFWDRRIHFWYYYLDSIFGCLQKSMSTSGTGGSTDNSVLWIFDISPLFKCWRHIKKKSHSHMRDKVLGKVTEGIFKICYGLGVMQQKVGLGVNLPQSPLGSMCVNLCLDELGKTYTYQVSFDTNSLGISLNFQDFSPLRFRLSTLTLRGHQRFFM